MKFVAFRETCLAKTVSEIGADISPFLSLRDSLQHADGVLLNEHARFGVRGKLTGSQRAIHIPAHLVGETFLKVLRISQGETPEGLQSALPRLTLRAH